MDSDPRSAFPDTPIWEAAVRSVVWHLYKKAEAKKEFILKMPEDKRVQWVQGFILGEADEAIKAIRPHLAA